MTKKKTNPQINKLKAKIENLERELEFANDDNRFYEELSDERDREAEKAEEAVRELMDRGAVLTSDLIDIISDAREARLQRIMSEELEEDEDE